MTSLITVIASFFKGFFGGGTPHRTMMRHDKRLRDNLGEGQVDAMIDDSFPASDPPSTY